MRDGIPKDGSPQRDLALSAFMVPGVFNHENSSTLLKHRLHIDCDSSGHLRMGKRRRRRWIREERYVWPLVVVEVTSPPHRAITKAGTASGMERSGNASSVWITFLTRGLSIVPPLPRHPCSRGTLPNYFLHPFFTYYPRIFLPSSTFAKGREMLKRLTSTSEKGPKSWSQQLFVLMRQ